MIRQTHDRFVFGNESVLGAARILTDDDDLTFEYPDLTGTILIQSINRLCDGQPNRATPAMQEILRFADQHNHATCLIVASSGPLHNDDLIAWYRRLGFKNLSTNLMIREPNP